MLSKPTGRYCNVCGKHFIGTTHNCPEHYRKRASMAPIHEFFDTAIAEGRSISPDELRKLAKDTDRRYVTICQAARRHGFLATWIYNHKEDAK